MGSVVGANELIVKIVDKSCSLLDPIRNGLGLPESLAINQTPCVEPTRAQGESSILDLFAPDHRGRLGTNVVLLLENLIGDGETVSDEGHLFWSLYISIVDAIVSEQTKELVANVPNPDGDDGFRTPKFAPRLRWVAEACPAAPIKSTGKCRNIDTDLCRKLEF